MAEDKYQSIHPPEVVQMEYDNQPPSPLSDIATTPTSTAQRRKMSLVPELSDNDETDSLNGPPRVTRKVTPPSNKNRQYQKLPSRITTQNPIRSSNKDEITPKKKKFFMKKTDAPFDENPIASPNMSSIERTLLRLKGQKVTSSKVGNQRKAKISQNMRTSPPSIDEGTDEIMGVRKSESIADDNKSKNVDNTPDDEPGFLSKRNILAEMDEMEDFIIAAKSSEVSSPEKEPKGKPRPKPKPETPMNGIPSEIMVDVSPAVSSDVGPRDETDEVMPRKSSKRVEAKKEKPAKIDEENDEIIKVTANIPPSPSVDKSSQDEAKAAISTESNTRKLVESSPEEETTIDENNASGPLITKTRISKNSKAKELGTVSIINEKKTNSSEQAEMKNVESPKESELKITIKEGNIHVSKNEKASTQEPDMCQKPESNASDSASCKGLNQIVSVGSNADLVKEKKSEDVDSSFEQEVDLQGVSLGTVLNDAVEAVSSLGLLGTTLASSGQADGEFMMTEEEESSAVSPDRPKNPEEIAAEWRRRKREAVNQARLVVGESDSQPSPNVAETVSFTAKSQDDSDMTEIADNRLIDDLGDNSSNSHHMPSPIRVAAHHEPKLPPAATAANKSSSSGVTGWWMEKELARQEREHKVKAASQRKPGSATTHSLVETSASENSAEPLGNSSPQKTLELNLSLDDLSTPNDPKENAVPENEIPEETKTKSKIDISPTVTNAVEELGNHDKENRGDLNDTAKPVQEKENNEIGSNEANTLGDIGGDAIGKVALDSALSGESNPASPDSMPPEPVEEKNISLTEEIIEDSTTPDGTPALVRSLDDTDGICKGDLILSLLHTGGQGGKSSDSGATQIRKTLWRTRMMRRRFGLGVPNDSSSLPLVRNSQVLPPRKQESRQSLPVDVDDVRTVGALNQIAALEKNAIEDLRHDDFEGALDLYDDIFYAYTETYINQDKNISQERTALEKAKSNTYLGNALHNLGIIHFLNHEYKDALSYFLRAEVKRASPDGVPNSYHLTTMVKIAMCHYALEDFSKAHKGLELCLEGAKVYCNTMTDFVQVAEILNNLGCLSFMCGQLDVAMKMFTESLDVQQSVLHNSLYGDSILASHTSSLNASVTQANIAFINMCKHDHSAALGLFEAALLTQQVLLYDTHETLICTMDHLAAANLMGGSKQKAIHMLERMLRAQITIYGHDDAQCESTRNKIVMARSNDGASKNDNKGSITKDESTPELEGKYVITDINVKNEDAKLNSFLDKEDAGINETSTSKKLQDRTELEKSRHAKEELETEQLQTEAAPTNYSQVQQPKPLIAKPWKKLGTSFRRSSKSSI